MSHNQQISSGNVDFMIDLDWSGLQSGLRGSSQQLQRGYQGAR